MQTTYSSRGRRATRAEILAWQAFLRAHANALRTAEQALAAAGALSLSEYDALVQLARAPTEGLRPTELADRGLITKSGLTRLLDRLVELGYVDRHACPSDRRGHLVVLTPAGRRAFKRATPTVVRAIARCFSGLEGDAELAAFRRSCERVASAAAGTTT